MKARVAIVVTVAAALIAATFFIPRIPQSEAYHHFADTRTFLHVSNCLNVLSNAIFLFVGAAGIRFILRTPSGELHFVDTAERWPWLVFFGAVFFTAFGSGYYHLNPRPYALVQFGSLPILLLLLLLFPARYTHGFDFAVSLAFYAAAKIFESGDAWIFALGHVVSGHTIKHLVAGLSTWWLLHMLKRREPALQFTADHDDTRRPIAKQENPPRL